MILPFFVVIVRIPSLILHFAPSISRALSSVMPSHSQYIIVEASHGDCIVSPLSEYAPNMLLHIFACTLFVVKLRVAAV